MTEFKVSASVTEGADAIDAELKRLTARMMTNEKILTLTLPLIITFSN
jgi:hypothetical protein